MRQPSAIKTKVRELDECYIYTYRSNAATLVREIKNGLESEGLGDLAGRLINDEENQSIFKEINSKYRDNLKQFEGKIYLPKFVIQEKESWRDIIFEADILSEIDWQKINVNEIAEKVLSDRPNKEQELTVGYSNEETELLHETGRLEIKGTQEVNEAFLARQLSDVIPNPWVAFEIGHKALHLLSKKYDKETIASNFIFIIEELKKILEKEKNKMAEEVFKKLLDKKKLCFFLIQENGHHLLPSHIKINSNKRLIRNDNTSIQNSLFDYVADEDLNDTEKSVAIYLDEQEQLLWWYRNRVRKDFHIQGWQRNKIYPDFITAKKSKSKKENYDKVYVLETKGVHLKANDDTRYKQNVFDLCNELGAKKPWKELFAEFPDHDFEFQVVFEDEWQNDINKMMQ